MPPKQYIEVNEFMQHLRREGFVLVKQSEMVYKEEADLKIKRDTLLKKPWITLKEVCDLKLLQPTTKQGLRGWIKNGTIRSNEHTVNNRGEIVILTAAVKRLAYIE
jgi:hypothetical protein